MRSDTLREHFSRMEAQRQPVHDALITLPPDTLWDRPSDDRWSMGETLQHVCKMMRLFRRAAAVALLVERPFAYARRRRPYPTRSRDLFSGRAMRAPRLIQPDRPARPSSPAVVWGALHQETQRLSRRLSDEDERVLGHTWLWDPVMGRQNLLQVVDLLAIHEAHHFQIMRTRWPRLFFRAQ